MTDIVERLKLSLAPTRANARIAVIDDAWKEIERLRALLRFAACPGGGWNGMPKDLEPTVDACLRHRVCGCDLGRALEGK